MPAVLISATRREVDTMKKLTDLRHLICVGVEKCGTTSLDAFFRTLPEFACPKSKETFYFSKHYDKGIEYYESLYEIDEDTNYLVDFTPSYFRHPRALQRIHRFPTEKKILYMMRNPIRRAYSFYIHDIYNHICVGQHAAENFARPKSFNFFDFYAARNGYYFTKYSENIRRLHDIFGEENVLLVVFEELISDFTTQIERIARFIDFTIPAENTMRLPHSNKITMPYYLYPTESDFIISAETGCYRIPQNRMCVARNGILQPLNCSGERAWNALALQGSWTDRVQLSQTEEILRQLFWDDISAVEEMIGRALPMWRAPKPLGAEKMDIFGKEAAEMDPIRFDKFRKVFAI